MATPSYRERMKAARAEARAKREAEDRKRWETIMLRRTALAAVKAIIAAQGDRLSLYSPAQLSVWADSLMAGWLVGWAAERNSQHLSKLESPTNRGLPLNETHAQIKAAQ